LGFNLSKTFENHLKQLVTQFSQCNSVNNSISSSKSTYWCGRRVAPENRFKTMIIAVRGIRVPLPLEGGSQHQFAMKIFG
jgi:hypothetical protein